jgi:hypothetical protein
MAATLAKRKKRAIAVAITIARITKERIRSPLEMESEGLVLDLGVHGGMLGGSGGGEGRRSGGGCNRDAINDEDDELNLGGEIFFLRERKGKVDMAADPFPAWQDVLGDLFHENPSFSGILQRLLYQILYGNVSLSSKKKKYMAMSDTEGLRCVLL